MTSRRDEEELREIQEAVQRVRESQQRLKESYQSLEEIGEVLCRLLDPESTPPKTPGG